MVRKKRFLSVFVRLFFLFDFLSLPHVCVSLRVSVQFTSIPFVEHMKLAFSFFTGFLLFLLFFRFSPILTQNMEGKENMKFRPEQKQNIECLTHRSCERSNSIGPSTISNTFFVFDPFAHPFPFCTHVHKHAERCTQVIRTAFKNISAYHKTIKEKGTFA